MLYAQTDSPASGGGIIVTSKNFEPARDASDTQAADDFVVPTRQVWGINQVDVAGTYVGGPADSVNVFIYANTTTGSNLPGTLVASRTGRDYLLGANPGDFVVSLSPPIVLTRGTYWLSVQVNQDSIPDGQWFWNNRTVQSNAGAAWINPGDGFATGCVSWFRRATCLSQTAPDQLFRLAGAAQARAAFGNFGGDGRADFGVWIPSNGRWFALLTGTSPGSTYSSQSGASGDIPVPADYDADGVSDPLIFRPCLGRWYGVTSGGASVNTPIGANGDFPVPADYDGDR